MSKMFRSTIKQDPAAQARVEAWIAALRSGEYVQIRGSLRSPLFREAGAYGYCCLGVRCEIENPKGWRQAGYDYDGDFDSAELPSQLALRDHLETSDGRFLENDLISKTLIELNDDEEHWSFGQIAEVIEAELKLALA